MLGGPAEGGPPCWMLVGDVGWVLVGGWLLVGWLAAVVFFSMKKSEKEGYTQVGFVLLPFPFPPPSIS